MTGLVLNMKYSHWHPVNSLPGLSHTTTYIRSISSPEVSGSLRVSLSGLPTAAWDFLLQGAEHTSVKWPKPWAVIHPLAKRKSWGGVFLQKLCIFPFGPSSMSQPWRCCSPRSRHHVILPVQHYTGQFLLWPPHWPGWHHVPNHSSICGIFEGVFPWPLLARQFAFARMTHRTQEGAILTTTVLL